MTKIKLPADTLPINRRKILKLGLGATALGLIGTPYVITSARAEQPLAGKKIGFSQSYATDEWLKTQRQDLLAQAAKHGMQVSVTDARENPAQEIRNLEDLAVRRVDAVVMITYYAEAVQPGVEALNDAGIPVIVMSSALAQNNEFSAHLAADTFGTARQAGEYYVKALNGSGKVAQIEGRPGSLVNQARGNGWHDIIDKQDGIEVVARGIANYSRTEALVMMQDFLQANKQIDAVYCHNDNMAKGALQAIEEAGRAKEMWLTGFDAIAVETFEMIAADRLKGSFLYPTFGAEAIEVVAAILEQKDVKKEIVFKSPMVTKENLSQFFDASKKERIVPPVDMKALGL
ncbi:substrate-binding domain-containing protein [Ochrobactrum sp. S1502_03]|uniref:substrate-binding domain-containing protein n=1 Tax=Ochrobactrum sp. S1502_03 TaxID=3108451 RepID=UPI0037CA6DD3